MTVTLNQCLALNTRQAVLGALLFQKLAQQKGLRLQPVRKRIMRKQVVQLVAKHGSATWFQHNQRHASLHLRLQFTQDAAQVALSHIEHSVVIERTTAAQMPIWHLDPKASFLQYSCGSPGGFGIEIVVKCIGPENDGIGRDFTLVSCVPAALSKPLAKSLGSKFR